MLFLESVDGPCPIKVSDIFFRPGILMIILFMIKCLQDQLRYIQLFIYKIYQFS